MPRLRLNHNDDHHNHDHDDGHAGYAYAVSEARSPFGATPGVPLPPGEASQYRALAARANYLALDRPDIQYAVKEIARRMSQPTGEDWKLLKRLARYLVGAPRELLKYCWMAPQPRFDAFMDSDWAACRSTGRSTSGGLVKLGWHPIKTWSTTQTVVAMSSGEAKLYSSM